MKPIMTVSFANQHHNVLPLYESELRHSPISEIKLYVEIRHKYKNKINESESLFLSHSLIGILKSKGIKRANNQ